jgi:hypothetical protein
MPIDIIRNWTRSEGPSPDYQALVAHLLDRHGDGLRWLACFDSERYSYNVEYIRDDLTTELSTHDLDVVIHRTVALFNRPYVEEVYTHLGDAQCLVLQHERATAVHVYLSDREGLVIKLRAGIDVTLPEFVDECLAVLYGTEEEPEVEVGTETEAEATE